MSSLDAVRNAGTDRGKAAASWVFDGNTSRENFEMFLKLSDDGDPAIGDVYGPPAWLSGEWADERTPQDLAVEFNLADDDLDEACEAYEEAADSAYWAELERTAIHHTAPEYDVTLADDDDPARPHFVATCHPRGWNGFHMPLLTASQLAKHLADIVAWRPDYFDGATPEVMDTEEGIIVRWGHPQMEDDMWPYGYDGRAWVDGLVWGTYSTED